MAPRLIPMKVIVGMSWMMCETTPTTRGAARMETRIWDPKTVRRSGMTTGRQTAMHPYDIVLVFSHYTCEWKPRTDWYFIVNYTPFSSAFTRCPPSWRVLTRSRQDSEENTFLIPTWWRLYLGKQGSTRMAFVCIGDPAIPTYTSQVRVYHLYLHVY
jgi:hypothetical protein